MKKSLSLLSVLATLAAPAAHAAQLPQGDLVLPGEKWLAVFNKYVCDARGIQVAAPSALEALQVKFDRLTTDSTLDNALIKATFVVGGQTCRYSAILFADNAAQTSKLVESRAFSAESDVDCSAGRTVLDQALSFNQYLYYGHPHNLAFMMPGVGAETVCGAGAQTVGPNFVVKGKITPSSESRS